MLRVPEDVAEQALSRFLAGRSWEALAREIAWTAVRHGGGDHSALEWLTALVEARLAERVDRLQAELEQVSLAVQSEHLSRWPDDLLGGGIASPADEAARELAQLYEEVLGWAGAVLAERLRSERPPRVAYVRFGAAT
jgi:hypothetical protein